MHATMRDPKRGDGRLLVAARASLAGLFVAASLTAGPLAAKDIGPSSAECDSHPKASPAWEHCLAAMAGASAEDSERFYAGYWLAKTGSYRAALDQLERIANRTAQVETYIGFSLRKLGDMDAALAHYAQALASNPDFTVARAYLGEAFLALGQPDRAAAELGEIARRCGTGCAEYADLAGHIARYNAGGRLPG